MTDARNTQQALEQWAMPVAQAQATQLAAEVWASAGAGTRLALLTQIALEEWAAAPAFITGVLSATEGIDMATLTGDVEAGVSTGVPLVPQGDVAAIGIPNSQDYPRLVFTAPRFEVVAIADIIEPSVLEAVEAVLPGLIPPYVQPAVDASIAAKCVLLVGSTMSGPLNLSPTIPTAPTMAATKAYVDSMVATSVPEVPTVPLGATWNRQTGQWVQAVGGGTVTNIATGAGLTGGPITATGTVSMANMVANSLKGNNTGAVASPTDIPAGTVLTMIGAAPLNSPAFTGAPSLPTGTAAITQAGGTNNTTVATTAFVVASAAAQLVSPAFTGNPTAPTPAPGDNDTSIATTAFVAASFAPLASPVFTGAPSLPTGTLAVTQAPGINNTTVATTAYVGAATANYLPLAGGTLAGPGNLTVRGGMLAGAAGTVPGAGSMLLNANAAAPASAMTPVNLYVVGVDGATGPRIGIDAYGTGTGPTVLGRHARGTAAAPTAVQSGDSLFLLQCSGYAASAWGVSTGPNINMVTNENWTATANGSAIYFATQPNGGTSGVNSLVLAGNTATFSGSLTAPTQISSTAVQVTQSGGNGYFLADRSTANVWNITSTGGTLAIYRDGTHNMDLDGSGNLQIFGATGTKSSGTTWANPSSRDIKQDIQPYAAGLQEVLGLTPRTFRFSDASGFPTDEIHIGLVHDETTHMPEMHRTMTIGGTIDEPGREVDGLDCSAITFALINAVKTLNERLTIVEGRVP